jgi:hypothetical protein
VSASPAPPVAARSTESRAPHADEAKCGSAGSAASRHVRKFSGFLPIIATALLSFVVGLFAGASVRDTPIVSSSPPPSMNQCTTDTVATLQPNQTPSPDTFREAREHCYSLLHTHELLKDFASRELNFLQQYRANGVLMWMVVVVTISGVLLAGLQLLAAYELARANRKFPMGNGEFSIKRDRVVLKSSIVGLFILVMSFAFFLVFVFYVYRFEHLDNPTTTLRPQTPTLPMGGLGPPVPTK